MAMLREGRGPRRFLRGHFGDFDALCAAITPWGLDFRQLDGGSSPSDLVQLSGQDLVVQRVGLSRLYEQRGEGPAGMRTLGFLEEGVEGVRWCGHAVTDADILLFHRSGDFEAVSRPGFVCWTLSLSEERLEAAAAALGVSEDRLSWADDRVMGIDPTTLSRFRAELRRLVEELESRPDARGATALDQELAFALPARVVAMLSSVPDAGRVPPSSTRDLAVRRARRFIEEHRGEPLTIRELCRQVAVSWRTLEYAFREHIGVTPKAYLKAVHLNAVRRELRDAPPDTVIADVANHWGFWHMGQFAADYRRLFGELPSQTLRHAEAQT